MKRLLFLVAATFPLFAAEPMPAVSPEECATLKVEEAAGVIEQGIQILDLRSKADWDKGHLPNSKQLSLADENFAEKVKAMMDQSKPLLVYCRGGRCSGKAVKLLREAGFAKVEELGGGIEAWSLAGMPVVAALDK